MVERRAASNDQCWYLRAHTDDNTSRTRATDTRGVRRTASNCFLSAPRSWMGRAVMAMWPWPMVTTRTAAVTWMCEYHPCTLAASQQQPGHSRTATTVTTVTGEPEEYARPHAIMDVMELRSMFHNVKTHSSSSHIHSYTDIHWRLPTCHVCTLSHTQTHTLALFRVS